MQAILSIVSGHDQRTLSTRWITTLAIVAGLAAVLTAASPTLAGSAHHRTHRSHVSGVRHGGHSRIAGRFDRGNLSVDFRLGQSFGGRHHYGRYRFGYGYGLHHGRRSYPLHRQGYLYRFGRSYDRGLGWRYRGPRSSRFRTYRPYRWHRNLRRFDYDYGTGVNDFRFGVKRSPYRRFYRHYPRPYQRHRDHTNPSHRYRYYYRPYPKAHIIQRPKKPSHRGLYGHYKTKSKTKGHNQSSYRKLNTSRHQSR